MALRECSECGREVSERATSCPHCGCPLGEPVAAAPRTRRALFYSGIAVVAVVAVLGALTVSGQIGAAPVRNLAVQLRLLPSPTPAPCGVQAKVFVAAVDALLDDWDDANALASTTSRIALAPQVSRLQELRRQVADAGAPVCAVETRVALIDYMDAEIQGYTMFMAGKDEADISKQLLHARGLGDIARLRLAKLRLEGNF